MKHHVLALAAAVALAGCQGGNSQTGTDSTNNTAARSAPAPTAPAPDSTVVGIAGPGDVLQNAVSDQLFARLIDGAAAAPAPTAALLAGLDQIVSVQALDVLDALKADAEAGQGTLTAPQDSQTAATLTRLLTSVAGLLTSLAPAGAPSLPTTPSVPGVPTAPALPGLDALNAQALTTLLAGLPGADQLPRGATAPSLPGLPSAGNLPALDATQLAAKADALRVIAIQLRAAKAQAAAAPGVPVVLDTVASLVDDAITVLQSGTNPAAYQANVTLLAENLADNLQALPAELAKAKLPSAPALPGTPGLPSLPVDRTVPALPLLSGLPLSANSLLALLQLPGVPAPALPTLPSAPAVPGAPAAPTLSLDTLKTGLAQLTGLLPQ